MEKGWRRCAVSGLGPAVGRGGNALANDTREAGVKKAWATSQRPCTPSEMCLMVPTAQGTKCWSLSLWPQCPQSHSHIYTKARTPVAQKPVPATFTRGDQYRCFLWVHCEVGSGRSQKFQIQRAWPERKFCRKVSILEPETGSDGGWPVWSSFLVPIPWPLVRRITNSGPHVSNR